MNEIYKRDARRDAVPPVLAPAVTMEIPKSIISLVESHEDDDRV